MSGAADRSGSPGQSDPARARRLRWRCRRGMRELDQLLERRLDALLAGADEAGLSAFEQLLACEDDQLWRWCLGHERPDQGLLTEQVDAIRADHTA